MSDYTLDFELPLLEIEEKIDTLKSTGINTGMDVSDGIKQLEEQLVEKRKIIYENLSRWERVQLARHPKRPYSSDLINRMTDYWMELHGDSQKILLGWVNKKNGGCMRLARDMEL